jgi:hypothetical protein
MHILLQLGYIPPCISGDHQHHQEMQHHRPRIPPLEGRHFLIAVLRTYWVCSMFRKLHENEIAKSYQISTTLTRSGCKMKAAKPKDGNFSGNPIFLYRN